MTPRRTRWRVGLPPTCVHDTQPTSTDCDGLHAAVITNERNRAQAESLAQILRGCWDPYLTPPVYLSLWHIGKQRQRAIYTEEFKPPTQGPVSKKCRLLIIIIADIEPDTGKISGTGSDIQNYLRQELPKPIFMQAALDRQHGIIILSSKGYDGLKRHGDNEIPLTLNGPTYGWIIHFFEVYEAPHRLFNAIAALVIDVMMSRRNIEHAAPNVWGLDTKAATTSDFLLHVYGRKTELYRRAPFESRPWGHRLTEACHCAEPQDSAGKPRRWTLAEYNNGNQAKLSCSWCRRVHIIKRSDHGQGLCPQPMRAGDHYYVVWAWRNGECYPRGN
ncbi:hypothetical protein FS749_002743 [Ceratobasidium sp. UAMH 11750]|nr:hypothetical protein FS749_002743 [Ceratobasidium sp. UAMH 11750]